jgi:CDP-6-deoxy-D-xylo-4-hexulose-3-dehydrase
MDNKRFILGKSWVDVSGAVITEIDKEYLHDVVDKGWYTEGFYCKSFENNLKAITGKKYVQLVNSGSSASLIAMTSALKKFDPSNERPYVLTCATAFPTTVNPIYQKMKIPLYIDINPLTLEPDYSQIIDVMSRYNDKISGAIFTHTMGFPFDEWFLRGIFKNEFLISDCCDALGSAPVGSYVDLSTYSFFPAHHVTSGEGGAVATDDPELAELARCYSNWGRSCYCKPGQDNTCGKRFEQEDRGELPEGWDHKYIFSEIGYNLKMTEFQGALGYSQSLRLDAITEQRRSNYNHLFISLENFEHIHLIKLPEFVSPFGFTILVNQDAPFTARELIAYLEEHKIRTRRLFAGNITKQPGYINKYCMKPYSLEGSDRVMNDMFWIGCHPALTTEMLEYVVEIFHGFMKKYE